nr:PREDICTED: uncharacterized protein LOC108201060 [Daucus carota subsp. sativus]
MQSMLSLLELKVVGIATLDLGEVSMLGISNPSLTLPSMIFGMRTLKDVSTLDFIEILQFQEIMKKMLQKDRSMIHDNILCWRIRRRKSASSTPLPSPLSFYLPSSKKSRFPE